MRLPHLIPYSKSPLYFLTACTHARRPLLACRPAMDALTEVWRRSPVQDGWFIGRFVLMPDHVHLFAAPAPEAKSLGEWCKLWKSVTARRLARELQLEPPIWQPDTFDHILRGVESYRTKWEYVRANPVRAGLSASVDDWPWQGELERLRFM